MVVILNNNQLNHDDPCFLKLLRTNIYNTILFILNRINDNKHQHTGSMSLFTEYFSILHLDGQPLFVVTPQNKSNHAICRWVVGRRRHQVYSALKDPP